MNTLVTIIHVFTTLLLVLTILLQSGKGAEVSASLSGSSQTVFGSSGGANFFTRLTSVLAAIFMMTSLGLTVLNTQSKKSVFETGAIPAAPAQSSTTPAQGAAATPAQNTAPAQGAAANQAAPAEQKAAKTAETEPAKAPEAAQKTQ